MLDRDVHRRIPLNKILEHEALLKIADKIKQKFFPKPNNSQTDLDQRFRKNKKNAFKSVSLTNNHIDGLFKKSNKRKSKPSKQMHGSVTLYSSGMTSQPVIPNLNNSKVSLQNNESENIYKVSKAVGKKAEIINNNISKASPKRMNLRSGLNIVRSVEKKLYCLNSGNNLNRARSQLKINPPILRYLSIDKNKKKSSEDENIYLIKKPKVKEVVINKKFKNKEEHKPKKTIKLFGKNKYEPKRQSKLSVKRAKPKPKPKPVKSQIRNKYKPSRQMKNPKVTTFKPRIINRKQMGISTEKRLQTNNESVSFMKESNLMFYKTLPAGGNPLNIQIQSRGSEALKGSTDSLGTKTLTNTFLTDMIWKKETKQKDMNIYLTPSSQGTSNKLKSFNLKKLSIQKSTKAINSHKISEKIYSLYDNSEHVKNSNTREVSKPRIIKQNSGSSQKTCIFVNYNSGIPSPTITSSKKKSMKSQTKNPISKDTRKTLKKMHNSRQKMKKPITSYKNKKTNFSKKKASTKDMKSEYESRLREFNKLRNKNKGSIYEEYLRRTKTVIEKLSLKSYYKIPKELTNFRKVKKI